MDKGQSQKRLTSEARCFVHGAVQLTSSGLQACRIFGRSGNARIVDTVELSSLEMASSQRKSGRTMRREQQNSEVSSCLNLKFWVLVNSVCALQVFFYCSELRVLSHLLLSTVWIGSLSKHYSRKSQDWKLCDFKSSSYQVIHRWDCYEQANVDCCCQDCNS